MGGKNECTLGVSPSIAEFLSERSLDPNKTTEELVWPCGCGSLGHYQLESMHGHFDLMVPPCRDRA